MCTIIINETILRSRNYIPIYTMYTMWLYPISSPQAKHKFADSSPCFRRRQKEINYFVECFMWRMRLSGDIYEIKQKNRYWIAITQFNKMCIQLWQWRYFFNISPSILRCGDIFLNISPSILRCGDIYLTNDK